MRHMSLKNLYVDCFILNMYLMYYLKMDLNEWVVVLNKVDRFLEVTISANPGLLLPEKEQSSPDTGYPRPVEPSIIHSLAIVMKFTSSLLKGCYNKEIYNSTQVH